MDKRFYKIALFTFAILFLLGVSITFAQPVIVQPRDEQPLSNGGEASHFINPPTYDSGWVNITNKQGQSFGIVHDLNTTDVLVEIAGKQYAGEVGGHQINFGSANILPSWNKTFDDIGYSPWIFHTIDGGYVFSGFQSLYKIDSNGNLEWDKTYTGGILNSFIPTSDGGFALAGWKQTFPSPPRWDFWLVKTNSSGDPEWNQTYGYHGYNEEVWGLVETSDGGYALVGCNETFGAEGGGAWLVKTNSTGSEEWARRFNGTICAYSIIENDDGSLVIACESYTDNPTLIKVDSLGYHQWNKTYGQCLYPHLVKTSDGGYAIAGTSTGAGYEEKLIKVDINGTLQWEQIFGGVNHDVPCTLIQTSDNGYVTVGETSSFGAGGRDIWVVKVDSFGNLQWNKTYGGSGDESGYSVTETIDGRFLIGGWLTASGSLGVVLKTELETGTTGISRTGLNNSTLTLYRGSEDPYWNYARVRLWEIKVPTWVYGDIDMDGDVDIFDIVKACGNYGVATISGGFGLVALGGVKRFKSKKENT